MQIINVDLIPGKVMPILHASQFDVGRSLGVKLYNGGAVYDLTGAEVVSVSVRKPDGNIVTEALTNSGGNELEIITTEQMTACAGASLCEIKIEDSGDVIGSANFVLEVEEDPLDGGIASQSEINNLATQVADLVSEQYDSANVIFDAVPTAGHGNGYTVTSEGIKDALDAINNPAASAVSYDNTASGLAATNVQDALDEAVDVFNDNFADAYDPTATYNTGDKCVYNNLLYECNDDGVTGAWDATKWDSLTVASMTDNNLPHFSGTPTAGTTAEAIASKADSADVYTKTQIDSVSTATVAPTAGNGNVYYKQIGNMVTVFGLINTTSGMTAGSNVITGLPRNMNGANNVIKAINNDGTSADWVLYCSNGDTNMKSSTTHTGAKSYTISFAYYTE